MVDCKQALLQGWAQQYVLQNTAYLLKNDILTLNQQILRSHGTVLKALLYTLLLARKDFLNCIGSSSTTSLASSITSTMGLPYLEPYWSSDRYAFVSFLSFIMSNCSKSFPNKFKRHINIYDVSCLTILAYQSSCICLMHFCEICYH